MSYWKIRALSEQQRAELLEAEVIRLQKQQDAQRTGQRVKQAVAEYMASGGQDLTEGNWEPDDEHETFVRKDAPPAAAS